MSLLQSEEFAIYQLRTGYLANIKDGVGERLINVNTSILSSPAFRAAGWILDPSEVKRTYSPPIPTAGVSEYFRAPARTGGFPVTEPDEEEDEGGIVTGGGNNETVGPTPTTKRRRRKEQLEDDDSSDLSDESDDGMDTTAAQQIKFSKMRVRRMTDSSHSHSSRALHNDVLPMPASPERHHHPLLLPDGLHPARLRTGRHIMTGAELPSDNELDSPKRSHGAQIAQLVRKTNQDNENDETYMDAGVAVEANDGDESDVSTLSSGFVGSADSDSLLPIATDATSSSPLQNMQRFHPFVPSNNGSPKRQKQVPPTLQTLPRSRPISAVQPISALALAIRARNKEPMSPFDHFATLSGDGDPKPLYIRIYAPFATDPTTSFELLLRRHAVHGVQVTVADAIGLSLFRYAQKTIEPPIGSSNMNLNRWTLRMVEDGEVDFDFPALGRARPIIDFTSNNNRPVRGKLKDRPWDEFALVKATQAQFEENELLTPTPQNQAKPENALFDVASTSLHATKQPPTPAAGHGLQQNPIMGTNFAPGPARKDSANMLDAPNLTSTHANHRMGTEKTLKIHFTNGDLRKTTVTMDVTTGTYIGEVFDQVCKRLNLDKAAYVLKVTGTTTVAPADRTIESMGDRSDLDLTRRRFIGDGAFGVSGSPGGTSPNAPLIPTSNSGTPKKQRRLGQTAQALTSRQDLLTVNANNTSYKRFNVIRKQPMYFSSSHQRILAIDGEYMHIMPPDTGKTLFDAAAKTTTIHFSSVVGCKVSRKHPKTFRVIVYKERESKRYDFEATNVEEASEIVQEIKKGVEPFQDTLA